MLLLGVLVLAATSPARAAAVEAGVVTDLSWGISNQDKSRTATMMADAGVRWTRIGVGWRNLEPSKGSYSSWNLADEDAAVQAASDAGVKIVLDVLESPQWASGSTNKYATPQNPQDLANFMRFIADRYKGKVQAYEIWNEENTTRFWPSGPNATAYTALLKAAYPAIKSADPSATVVFGGLANSDYHYVEAAYAAGAKGYFDVMGVHPYSCWAPNSYWWVDSNENWLDDAGARPSPSARVSEYTYPGYHEVHNSMVAAGDDKPIWFTEFGWSSSGVGGNCTVDDATQAQYLTQAYQMAQQDPYVQVALWYNFREDYWASSATDWDAGFGLLGKDFAPKPAFEAFRAYATGASPGPNPTPAPASTSAPAPSPTALSSQTLTGTASPNPTRHFKKQKKRRARKNVGRRANRVR